MTRHLRPAERLAAVGKDVTLAEIVKRSAWDQHVVEQAVFAVGLTRDEFSCNDLRVLLPEQGHGFLGAAINSLRGSGVIEHTGQMVFSTSSPTHGHRIAVWRLTNKGRLIAARRRQAQAVAA
ncbi:hypothetical protein FHS39_002528 [Streptomyces olivoverticillatus]|uniref:MarR family transcriptional regulator n=1 Tax=Streptomyces olivoverticillatus TaxID=66427 RepID=A0A7W7LPA2_9ACTN|nr:hypothetical protein [Streptomyces olivoverticillatus]MBB4893497.1 hypothetical protein [Streptomyces olivoverticillatus]